MTRDVERSKERSVDSLQQIYAVVIALAISQSIESLLKDPIHGTVLQMDQILVGLLPLIAIFATLIPFWHGMNRHLDRCYLEKKSAIAEGALLFDFATFFLEAGLLFAAGWSLRSGIRSFIYLGLLLVVDMIWATISHQIHFRHQHSHALRWSIINIAAMLAALPIVACPVSHKTILLMVIAVLRSVVDYKFGWSFYFPRR